LRPAPSLSKLTVSAGTLSPSFASSTTIYTLQTPEGIDSLAVTPTTTEPDATLSVNGMSIASGTASAAIAIGTGVTMITVTVMAAGQQRSYGIAVTRSPLQYIKASNTDADDYFGLSVSLSGDTLAVGAPLEASSARGVNGDQSDNRAPDSGAVYVFVRSGGAWSQQAYIKASNSEAGDFFGGSVALSGESLAVGAFWESSRAQGVGGDQSDNSASRSGAAYLYNF
jgi:hypothetical protein